MRKVGIIPSVRLFADDDLYNDRYTFVNNYALRVFENGGIPVGVLAKNGYADEAALDICDSFVIAGGTRIWPLHFQTVDYAVRTGKPLLGICLGAQVISTYFSVAEEAEKRNFEGPLIELYDIMKKERFMFVKPVEHHWDVHMIRGQENKSKHRINIVPDTLYSKIMDQRCIMGATMHNYAINELPRSLKASGFADDGIVEAVEYSDYILGVQYHPEVDSENDMLFKYICGTI